MARHSLTSQAASASLPALVDRAAAALTEARTSAEVLEARDMAGVVYDLAKRTARLMRAKQAHDELVSAAYRAQGDALLIESRAKIRLADEIDANPEDFKTRADNQHVPDQNKLSAEDIGLTRKDVHEARQLRDAEARDPGVVRRAIDERLNAGQEPTKAAVREAIQVAPRQAPAVTGDTAVYHAIYEARAAFEPLGPPRAAMRRFSPQLRHDVSVADLEGLADWFAQAADEWREITGQTGELEAAWEDTCPEARSRFVERIRKGQS